VEAKEEGQKEERCNFNSLHNKSAIFLLAEESIGGLTDIKAKKNSARSRLEKKILNKLAIFNIYTLFSTGLLITGSL